MRDRPPPSLLGDGSPRSLNGSLSREIPMCFGFENSFFFFLLSGCSDGCWVDPARGNTTLAAVVATLGDGWFIRSGGGASGGGGSGGGEALPLLREDRGASSGLLVCCMAAWAAMREAETGGIWSDEAVGSEGSKNPCEWCLDRCLCSSEDGPRPEGRRLSCGIGRPAAACWGDVVAEADRGFGEK